MSKQYSFDVRLIVADHVDEDRAAEVLRAMISDLEQDEEYHEALLVDDIESKDDTTERVFGILENIDDEDLEKAKDAIEEMEEDDE